MAQHTSPYQGMLTAANDHYHGARSINEFGAIAHANKLAEIYLREGQVASEEEAVALASHEVQRLMKNSEGYQANRLARQELRAERRSCRTDPLLA
ncbi:hypothetical protein D9M71_98630 [compost metagenome]